MPAELIPAPAPHLPHHLLLPARQGASSALEEVRYALGNNSLQGALCLRAGDWLLRLPELGELASLLAGTGLRLVKVSSSSPETLVAAAAAGLEGEWPWEKEESPPTHSSTEGRAASVFPLAEQPGEASPDDGPLTIHRGTLRAGDHLQSEGSVLLLGDLNPGARISAAGHVLVWGRLRGVAHAGRHGARTARIIALQLRPLQLRIADAVARGPEGSPPAGLAEEARLVEGVIRIDPAQPGWPISH
jgi:septum site-determining protein MinC